MNLNQSVYLCLMLALFLSNLPFLGKRPGARQRAAARSGGLPVRLALWLVLYGVWMAITAMVEDRVGAQIPKDWSIWPISIAFFAVLAFPGVVYRYLWRF